MIDLFYIYFCLINFSYLLANFETLHFESACLQSTTNRLELNLQCSTYEHIQIIRIIYGYTKQIHSLQECQFSIYDCIQEGTSENILSCNGKQTCSIHLTKNEILATARNTNGVPTCPDFNYVQVNFGCISDSKDICDSWKDEGPIIHLSHTFSNEQQMNYCHCKIRSSMSNGQVLLRMREPANHDESFIDSKMSHLDCKQMTYLEIVTDRLERKCMDRIPLNTNALFGSGSHNFSLTYVKKERFSELFFAFELKASPVRKDHNVQIICNWKRRQTSTTTEATTAIISTTMIPSTTIPISRKRTTIGMDDGGKLSRWDLIRHRPGIQDHHIDLEDTTTIIDEEETVDQEEEAIEEEEEEEEILPTTTIPIKTKKAKRKHTIKSKTTTTTSSTSDDDEEWSRIISLAEGTSDLQSSKQMFSMNNRTFINNNQPLIPKTQSSITFTSNTYLFILLLIILLTCFILIIYCIKVKRPDCLERIRLNTHIALIFCCEAGKLLFCSSKKTSSIQTPTSTIDNRHSRPSTSMPDYQSSEYYLDETGNPNCHTTQSIYDSGGGVVGDVGGKSIYSIDYDEETEYTTKYDRHHDCGSC